MPDRIDLSFGIQLSNCHWLHNKQHVPERLNLSDGARLLPDSNKFRHADSKWLHNQHKLSDRRNLHDEHVVPVSILLSNQHSLPDVWQLRDELLLSHI